MVTVFLSLGFNQQLPRSILYVDHRIRSVAEQVQDDLLKLKPVARHSRQIFGKLRLKSDSIPLELVRQERDDLLGGLVQIQRLEREVPLDEERTQPRNHIGSPIAVSEGAARRLARTLDVWRSAIQHAEACPYVRND